VRAQIGATKFRFELTKDGLIITPYRARHPHKLAFSTLLERSKIQFELPLQEPLKLK
jgi:hypothetical protein